MTSLNCSATTPYRFLIHAGILVFLMCSLTGYAQQALPQQKADSYYYAQSYPLAIDGYTELLKDASLPSDTKKDVLFNLANAYRQVGDFVKAETKFREFLEMGEPMEKHALAYLHYAQTLGNNGKIQQAQEMFERYEAIKKPLSYSGISPNFSAAGAGKEKVTYRIENLEINSSNAEFSPAYFRDGLVYVAGKGSSSVSSPDKGYLDLYYVPERNSLITTGIIGADGKQLAGTNSSQTRIGTANVANRRLGRDASTAPTANDSRTVGYAPFSFSEGLGLTSSKAAKSTAPEGFSKELNTKYHEGPVTFSADGSTIYFTRNNFNEGKSQKSSDNVNKLKLYSAVLQDGGWTNVQELPFNSDEYSTGHPALSRDGRSLYFVSDRPGGLGGTDVYVARQENGSWSQPVNLGAPVNTKGDEMFPFIDESGNLYFASNGQANGLGGLDIYFTQLPLKSTTEVTHLDSPINSKADDFGLITDGRRSMGFLSSNRRNGDDDIFRFVRESALSGCRNLTLRVFEEGNYASLDSVEVTIKAGGEGRDEQKLFTNSDGVVALCLEAENDFLFELAKDGYVSGTLGFSTTGLTDDKPTQMGASLLKFIIEEADSLPSRMSSGAEDTWESDAMLSVSTLRGTVTGEPGKSPIEGVKLILKNECDGSIKQTVTGPNGRFEFALKEGCGYTLVASKPSYGTNTNAITKIPAKSTPKLVSANLQMLKAGDLVLLDNILYDTGKWDIRKDAARELDKMVTTMRKYPSLKIEIGSHTDSQGNDKFNQYLSERRAKAALNYLASKGISRNRMTARGYGEEQLLNQCKDGVLCTEEEHQRNRRTEFKVISIR